MGLWLGLLAASVAFGAAVVGLLVMPHRTAPLAVLLGIVGIMMSAAAFAWLSERYGTAEGITLATVVFVAGITAGYAIAAALLPYLAKLPLIARGGGGGGSGPEGLVLLCCSELEHYSPVAVARRQQLLFDSAQVVVPATAMPFVFLAERTRYRATGGLAPGAQLARRLAERILQDLPASRWTIGIAWCDAPDTLISTVDAFTKAGKKHVVVVVLGPPEAGPLDEVHARLDAIPRGHEQAPVIFAPSIWNDRQLAERLTERIMTTASGDPAEVGVVLVGEGVPPLWQRRYAEAEETHNYFDQRVKVLLTEAGVQEQHVRVAWLGWQTPDVTEAVRHVAALGCKRVVVAPATIALPTMETVLDLSHSLSLARLPENVQVVTLTAWGDDQGLADAVLRSAEEALGDAVEREAERA